MSRKIDRTGEVSYTKYGTPAIIVEYVSNKKILIEFQDEHKYSYYGTYINFKKGTIYNPYDKSFFGIGYLGNGKFDKKNSKDAYYSWISMLERCYCENRSYKHTSYVGCTVYNEWHNFQNFAKWYANNLYACPNKLNIDKDILEHDNKIYSPNNCLLVPDRINYLFIKGKSIRGDLPIGVSRYWCDNKKYLASVKLGNKKSKSIGIYETPHEAFLAYKNEKEKYIKAIANEYINIIPKKVYDALMNYEVLETD